MTLHKKTRLIKHGNLAETGFVKGLQTVFKEFPKGFCSSLVIFYFKEKFFVSLASACHLIARCLFLKRSEDLVQKIISLVIFDTNCSFKQLNALS